MALIIGVDPGTLVSGVVVIDQSFSVTCHYTKPNEEVLGSFSDFPQGSTLAIEQIESMGMAVGREVMETIFWTGRFYQAWGMRGPIVRVTRRRVKLHLCQTMKAKDANIRRVLLDRFGGNAVAVGNKRQPGPLHGVSGHEWQALAVAVTYWDRLEDNLPF